MELWQATQNLERKGAANNSKSFAWPEAVVVVMVAITPNHRVSERLILQVEREVGFLNVVDIITRGASSQPESAGVRIGT